MNDDWQKFERKIERFMERLTWAWCGGTIIYVAVHLVAAIIRKGC